MNLFFLYLISNRYLTIDKVCLPTCLPGTPLSLVRSRLTLLFPGQVCMKVGIPMHRTIISQRHFCCLLRRPPRYSTWQRIRAETAACMNKKDRRRRFPCLSNSAKYGVLFSFVGYSPFIMGDRGISVEVFIPKTGVVRRKNL